MTHQTPLDYKNRLQLSGLDIYSPIEIGDAELWIPTLDLEILLNQKLMNLDLRGLPLRTRSKVAKIAVCEALGYPVPKSFKKTKPRFAGQQLDTYTQKSNNLQIWNEDLSPTRRYAIIQISDQGIVLKVKVVNGQELALLDTTGTLTTKYQAGLVASHDLSELVSSQDTPAMLPHVRTGARLTASISPVDHSGDRDRDSGRS